MSDIALFFMGLVLVTFVFTFKRIGLRLHYPIFVTGKPAPIVKRLYRYGRSQPRACIFFSDDNELAIEYPQRIKIGDSELVQVRLEFSGTANLYGKNASIDEWPSEHLALEEPISITLSGANFSVCPQEMITNEAGSHSPVVWLWTITAKSTGNQFLLLNLENLCLKAYCPNLWHWETVGDLKLPDLSDLPWTYWTDNLTDHELDLYINGEKKNKDFTLDDLRVIPLRIDVTTIYGVSTLVVELTRIFFILVGFILMYPAVLAMIQRVLP